MARIIVTTVGTSLFESSCWTINDLNKEPLSSPSLNSADRELKRSCCSEELRAAMAIMTPCQIAAKFDKLSWNNNRILDLPAELASLRVLSESLRLKGNPLGANDKIILLFSESLDGKFCAEVIMEVLNGLFPDIVISEHIEKDLDPQDSTRLQHALLSIWDSYIKLTSDLTTNDQLILNLTGGYKATAILLAGLSAKAPRSVMITYLHETTPPEQLFTIYWKLDRPQFGYILANQPFVVPDGI